MVDASHGNSSKDFRRQLAVVHDVAAQLAEGEHAIVGMMMESFLVDGRQDLVEPCALRYGQSITDACMGWDMTVPAIDALADAVRRRRRSS